MEFSNIPAYPTFTKIESVTKGVSGDKKYYIETSDGSKLLLRMADISEYERKETMFQLMKQAALLGIPMPQPVDFGICNDGKNVYQLLTWCEGDNLDMILPTLSETQQYMHGIKAGEMLSKIHSIPAPENLEDWFIRYCEVNEGRINSFKECGIQIEGSNAMHRYYEDNKCLLKGRPQCFHHGDYHNGNFLIADSGKLSIIDWELLDYGNLADPWEEFNRIGNSEIIPHFTTGLIQGYFGGEPPEEFWRLLALYLSAGALMLVSWAFYMQKDYLDECVKNANDVLRWFDNMNNVVPTWYLKDFI